MLFGLDLRVVDLNLACFSRLGRGPCMTSGHEIHTCRLAYFRWTRTCTLSVVCILTATLSSCNTVDILQEEPSIAFRTKANKEKYIHQSQHI